MSRLEHLALWNTGVGDGTIASLACPGLQYLSLSDTKVTGTTFDPDLLGQLKHLSLCGAPLSVAGMERISRLPALQSISLIDTPMDEAALAKINGHPTLERIDLSGAPVSPRGVLGLIESLPKLQRLGRFPRDYSTPEAIATYAAELRTAPANARTIDLEDLEPVAGQVGTLLGSWTDLGRIVDDEWNHPRVFAYDHFGRLWVGCTDQIGDWRDPMSEAWQSPDWWPEGPGPIVLGNVGGSLVLGPDSRAWIGADGLWSYNMSARTRLRRELPPTYGTHVDVAFDRAGHPWVIRTKDKVWRMTRRGWKLVQIPGLPEHTALHAIAAHPDGSMWIACSRGLLRCDLDQWTSWEGPADGLPESYENDAWGPSRVTSMKEVVVAADGAVWASGGTGVVRFRDGEFTGWDHRDGLWPWGHLAVDATTGDVYGIGSRRIGRFDGSQWAVTEVPSLAGGVQGWGIRDATVRDGRLFVLTGDAHLREFTPNDLAERQAAAPSGRRSMGRRLRSLRQV